MSIETNLETFEGVIVNRLTEVQLESYFEGYIEDFRKVIQRFKERISLEGFQEIESFLEDGTQTEILWKKFSEDYYKKLF